MRTMLQNFCCLITLACFLVPAQAGVVVRQVEREPGSQNPAQQITMYIDAGKLRIEGNSSGDEDFVMIFDQSRQTVWMIQPGEGTYIEMTAADIQKMKQTMDQAMGQMAEAMKQMQAELANLPPEQRAMMEQMMKGRMPAMQSAPAPKVTTEVKSRGERVGPYTCTLYEVLTDGQRTGEVCVAPLDQVQLQQAEFDTFRAMAEFYEPLSSNAPEAKIGMAGLAQMDGFPVRWVDYDGQNVTSEWEVTEIERRSLETSLFAPPSGLQKVDMGMPQR
ncbi:MAG: DUF4412 domain-containing protein [Acidobacteria bacterium]|nr:DUF4412 domain-containing protein [Acidobacteriota bacterium]